MNTWLDHTMYPLLSTRLQVMWWPQETSFSVFTNTHNHVVRQWKPFLEKNQNRCRNLYLVKWCHCFKCNHHLSLVHQGSLDLWLIPPQIMAHTLDYRENPNTMKGTALRVKLHKQRQDGSNHHMKCLGLKWQGNKLDSRNVTIGLIAM